MITMKNNIKSTLNIKGNEIPDGETFYGTIGSHTGLFYKPDSSVIVRLDNIKCSWPLIFSVTIENYEPVDIEMTILKKF